MKMLFPVSIMKSVEFGISPASESSDSSADNNGSGQQPDLISGSVSGGGAREAGVKQSLELLLLEKNKKLQNEATVWRNNNASLQGEPDRFL